MEIIVRTKTTKYHKCLFATELIFCNDPKPNGIIPLGFGRGNQSDANFLAYKNTNTKIPQALCGPLKNETCYSQVKN